MLFKQTFKIHSAYTATASLERLQKITSAKLQRDSNHKFEGKFSGNSFDILPTYDYSNNDRIRPRIVGTINDNGDGKSTVEVKFDLPGSLKSILYFAVPATLLVIAGAAFLPRFVPKLPVAASGIYVVISFFAVFLLVFIATYRTRVRRALYWLERLWEGTEPKQ